MCVCLADSAHTDICLSVKFMDDVSTPDSLQAPPTKKAFLILVLILYHRVAILYMNNNCFMFELFTMSDRLTVTIFKKL